MQKDGVNKFIFLFLTFIFLIGVVSAWSASITNPVNGSYFGSKPDSFDWSFSGIDQSNLSNGVDSFYFINNGNRIYFRAYSDYPDVAIQPGEVQEGWNELNISINNITGGKENASVLFWVDSISPILNYIIPSSNLIYTNLDALFFQFWLNESNKKSYHPVNFAPFSLEIRDPWGILFDISKLANLSSTEDTLSENYNKNILPGNLGEGNYSYILYAKDKYPNGNTIREVNITGVIVRDITAPTLTLNGANPITLEALLDPYVEFGATATDNLDPLINSNIIIDSSAVNTNIIGTYIVTYDVQDQAGNSATQIIRNVNVVDTTIPVITLVGNAIETIEVFNPYADAGATALDNYDGDITGNIVVGGDVVNTNILGTYVITYDLIDSSGNIAVQVTRIVNVVDTTIPVITLVGNAIETIEVFNPYADAGATALDNYDGDVTGSIITVNPVNTNIIGTYIVTYNVIDSSGNSATQITRNVNVVDTIFPTISIVLPTNNTFTKDASQNVNFIVEDITLNTCWYSNDTYTANITLVNCNTNITTFQWSEGQHNVTVYVNDSANNVNSSQVTFTIDTLSPTITNFQAYPSQNISQNNPTIINATDISDANLDFTGLMFVDFNNLISSNQTLFLANMNDTPVSGPYGPINWDADYFKITDGVISEPVSVFITDFAPAEYVVMGSFKKNSATSVESDCMLGFDIILNTLTWGTCTISGNLSTQIESGTSEFITKSLKFANGIFSSPSEINGSVFKLYNFGDPANPKLESALAPSGDYKLILQVEDSAGNENGTILNISVDNTYPFLTNINLSSSSISPLNADGYLDNLNLTLTASELIQDWGTTYIYNSTGNPVFRENSPSGSPDNLYNLSFIWDGTYHGSYGNTTEHVPDGIYTINTTITDQAGNIATIVIGSVIVDNTLPTLLGISATPISSSSEKITWDTNESANSNVSYGTTILTTSNLGSATFESSHSISLSSLSASTIYYYNVSSCDAGGNCNTSTQYSFTTSAQSGDTGGGSSGGGGGGGGSSSITYYACSKWNDWSACSNSQQTRTCLEKITTTSQKGVIASKFNATETQTCTASALTPLSSPTTETGKTEVTPVEPSEKTPTFIARITGGITGAAVGLTKSKGGKISLIVIAVLALAWMLLAFRRKINRQNKERKIRIIHKSDLGKR